ncbi:MAG: ATP phosphoribosyltransferase regulatory subunit [Pseudomonadota bacterium]
MSRSSKRWLLPDGVQETLPPDALKVESLRHTLLETFNRWGYELVMPAMIEYLDSLLTGTAHSLSTRTFTLVDQLSGKQMGVRSDMTPQVARIDSHLLADDARSHRISRLCYCGHLLHAIGDGITASRTPLQIGAEIFGSESISADVEIVSLMIETLHTAGLNEISLDIGHVGVFRSLVQNTNLDPDQENRLFDMLQRKSIPDLEAYLQQLPLEQRQRDQMMQLALLNGDSQIIEEARVHYSDGPKGLFDTLDSMQTVVDSIEKKYPGTQIHCDLSELRGYSYHTGLVFAAFLPGQGREIARGGRYDDVGEVFGNARPATGFSADLLNLFQLRNSEEKIGSAIMAPDSNDADLQQLINSLRDQGEKVIVDLSQGKISAVDQHCDRQINSSGGHWTVEEA